MLSWKVNGLLHYKKKKSDLKMSLKHISGVYGENLLLNYSLIKEVSTILRFLWLNYKEKMYVRKSN